MAEPQVKGALLLPYQKLILENKGLNWQEYLKEEDWPIINGKILNLWYPFSTFERCGLATFNLLAQKDLNAVKAWAKKTADEIFSHYKMVIEAANPTSGIENLFAIRKVLFDFNLFEVAIEKINTKHIKTTLTTALPHKQGVEPFTWQVIGWLEFIIEKTGGKNPTIEILAKQWLFVPNTILEIKWE
ncbi:MAG: hypothetical protein A2Y82_03580 [Candidatus Buchananbacteria bacterium RBG_13_36_9]|uniref:Uncharacterized protein n=1 Tax=Candidatus Buchananbacteria bacterium RBG_13_36_9 TaxID=1797530 RepID=A0A1G1XLK8_9BACT|nr:MAG: hypothetical protein A2Y82_03580 [Candidatus Buchananbacteria bacterium RBG_13_36_9]